MGGNDTAIERAVSSGVARMTPSEAFVETLVANGVTDVFGIVGSACMDALDLFPAAGIRYVPVVHEQGAGHMADGYARVSGRHGVCMAQNGSGITNFVTAVAAAYWAHSPVVVITPESGSMTMGLGGFQETDQLPIFSKNYGDAFNRHDVDSLISMMTGDCVFEAAAGPGASGTRHVGQDAVRTAFAAIFVNLPDSKWSNARHFVSGDRGVSEWTYTATRADGSRIESNGCDVFTFRDGRIAVKSAYRKDRPAISAKAG